MNNYYEPTEPIKWKGNMVDYVDNIRKESTVNSSQQGSTDDDDWLQENVINVSCTIDRSGTEIVEQKEMVKIVKENEPEVQTENNDRIPWREQNTVQNGYAPENPVEPMYPQVQQSQIVQQPQVQPQIVQQTQMEQQPQVQQTQVVQQPKGAIKTSEDQHTVSGMASLSAGITDRNANLFFLKEKTLFYKGIATANFYISLLNIYEYIDDRTGNCMETKLDLMVHVFSREGEERIYRADKICQEKVAARDFLNRFPGAITTCGNPSETVSFLYQYINWLIYNYDSKPLCLYTNSGWKTINNQHVYVDSNGAVGHPEINVKAMSELSIRNLWQSAIFPQFTSMLGIIKEGWKSIGLLLYVMIQVLHTVFEDAGFVPKFSLFVSGPRGSRKTAVCQCMTQLVCKNAPAINFLATESGIQNQLSKYRDQCMLIDDLAPSMDGTEKKRKEKMLEMVLRLFGDSGERVINPNFTAGAAEKTDYSVHGGVVLTGEYFYSTGSESSIARAVVLELERDSVNLELLTYFQDNPAILASLLYRLIVYVTNNYDKTIRIIQEQVPYYRKQARKFGFTNDRYADYMGQYMSVGYIAAEMFLIESNIDQNQYQWLISSVETGITALLVENDKKMKQRAPISVILSALLFALNCGKIGNWGTPFDENVRLVQKDGVVYFRQMDLSDIIREYCQKVNILYLKMSSTEIGKILDNSGLFPRHGSDNRLGRRYVTVYGNERLIDIPLDELKKYGEDHYVDF